MTKIDKVTKALKQKSLTAAQIRARFGVPNVSAVVYDIKRRGEMFINGETKDGRMTYSLRP